jgi:sirohydrochlorin ferrochelatase
MPPESRWPVLARSGAALTSAASVGPLPPVVLVAHGSRAPQAAATTRALARAVAAARPGLDVRVAFLELAMPRPAQVLSACSAGGGARPVVVPLLLTKAYHGRIDLPAQVRGFDCAVTDTLGAVSAPLLAGLARRLDEVAPGRRADYDAVVLAAAGTTVLTARVGVAEVARELGAQLGVPCQEAYASAAGPTGAEAVESLRAAGARRVAVASYFLAPGRLYDTVVASAVQAGAVAAAAPLGAARELVRLILQQVDAIDEVRLLAAA